MSIVTYRYGARVLSEHARPDALGDQLVRRTRYWNALVESEQAFRARIDELVAPHITGETEEEQRASRKLALKLPEVAAAIREGELVLRATVRKLRGESGLQRGTYLAVERSWQTARQREPRRLRFHRSSPHEGTLSHAWSSGGIPVSAFLGNTASLCSIEPVPDWVADLPSQNERKRNSWMPFRFRVGGNRSAPEYLTGVVCLHRPLPADGIVREARLRVWRNPTRQARYELMLVVETPESAPTSETTRWGIDFGWRQEEGQIRAAVAISDAGELRTLHIPEKLVGLFERARGLDSVIDTKRDELRATLAAYTRTATLPEPMREDMATLAQWRSVGRFHVLYANWERHDGDAEAYAALEAWHHRSRHLEQYLAGTRERATRWREHLYGNWALRLCEDAGAIAIEKANWSLLAQEEESYSGWQRGIASPGMLGERIAQTAARLGVAFEKVPSTHTTADCSWCGHRNTYDAAPAIVVRCGGCNRKYDQDVNAARNILARATGGQAPDAPSAQREARWKRIQRMRDEKLAATTPADSIEEASKSA